MASRYHSDHSEKKISAGDGPRLRKPSASAPIQQKQTYTGNWLPGKASHGFAEAKKGIREVSGYASYKGLSRSKDYVNPYREGQIRGLLESRYGIKRFAIKIKATR